LVWVPVKNLEYAHKQILEFEKTNEKRKDEEEYDSMEEEEEEVNKLVVEKKKSKKSTGQKDESIVELEITPYKPKKLCLAK
jgi:hypothetical protein